MSDVWVKLTAVATSAPAASGMLLDKLFTHVTASSQLVSFVNTRRWPVSLGSAANDSSLAAPRRSLLMLTVVSGRGQPQPHRRPLLPRFRQVRRISKCLTRTATASSTTWRRLLVDRRRRSWSLV